MELVAECRNVGISLAVRSDMKWYEINLYDLALRRCGSRDIPNAGWSLFSQLFCFECDMRETCRDMHIIHNSMWFDSTWFNMIQRHSRCARDYISCPVVPCRGLDDRGQGRRLLQQPHLWQRATGRRHPSHLTNISDEIFRLFGGPWLGHWNVLRWSLMLCNKHV